MFRPHDPRARAIPRFESRQTRRRKARRQWSVSYLAEFERLENRTLLSTVSDNGTSTVTITLAASETLSLSTSGNTVTFTSNTDFSNGGVAHSSDFSGFTSTTLTFNASDTTNYKAIDIVDGGTHSGATVTFNNSSGAYLDNVTVNLSDSSAGAITFLGSSTFGSNSLSATTTANIVVGNDSTATTVQTASGGITFSANQQATPNAGNFAGIEVNDATVESTGTGLISFAGRGGTSGTGNSDQYGVYITNGGVIEAGTTGTSTIDGTGGAAAGAYNVGIFVDTPGTSVSEITSNGGNVSITGQAGGTGSAAHEYGVRITSGLVTAGGTGSVTVLGTGASTTGDAALGVEVEENTGSTIDGVITSSGGPVTVTGQGAGGGGSNWGVVVDAAGKVSAGGTGTVSVSGAGGGDASGTDNSGVAVYGTITSSGGAVSVTGTPGLGTSQYGIEIDSGGAVSTASNAPLSLTADTLSINTSATPGTVAAGTGTVTIKEKTATTPINFVTSSGTGLWLTPAEVGQISAGTLQVGDANAGPIAFNAAITLPGSTNLSVTANGAITQSAALSVPGTTTLAAGSGNSITLNNAGNAFSTAIITSGDNVLLQDTTALNLGASTVSGTLGVTANGAITQSGALSVAGTSSFGAGAFPITLNTATNSFTGAVSLSNSGANNVALTNNASLVLGTSTVGQNLLVTVNTGGLSQTGVLTATGLDLNGTGTGGFNLSTQNNAIGTVAALLSGASGLLLNDGSTLSVGTVGGNSGITLTDGTLNVASAGSNTALTINNNIYTTGGSVTLLATGNLNVSSNAIINAGAGAVTLGADLTAAGAGDDGVGTLTINAGAAVYGTNITLRGADENIASTATVGSPTNVGPAAFYRLNETSGTTAYDSSGNAQNGTYAGGYTLGVPGVTAGTTAVALNGSGYISLPTEPFGNFPASPAGPTNNYTLSVEVWFKTTGTGVILSQMVGNVTPGGSVTGYTPAIYVGTDGKIHASLFYHASDQDVITSPSTYNNGAWHQVVDVYTNGVEKLYVDGSQVGTQTGEEYPTTPPYEYFIGTGWDTGWPDTNGGWDYFNGDLQNAAVYSTALTAAQISADYNAQTSNLSQIYATTQVTFQSSLESRPMEIGGSNNAAVAGINLTFAELARIFTTSTGTVTIGDGAQTGNITLDTATPATTAGANTVIVQSTTGPGQVILDSATGGPATALNGNGGSVALTAGTGGIVEASGDATGTDDIGNTATTSLTSAGTIGTAGAPLQLGATNLSANTSANNSNQFLSGTGAVTIDATGLNAGTGTIELEGGTFTLGGNNEINRNSSLNVNGGTFAIGGDSQTVSTLTLTSGSITGSGGTLTSANTIQTESGSISAILAGTGGLTQSTSGTTTLSGANTFSGTTTVSAGTLTFLNQTVPTAMIAIAAGAVLDYDYTNSGYVRQPTTTITGGGTLQKTGTGEIVFGGAGMIYWELSAGALIDVEAGDLDGGNSIQDVWTSNLSNLNIASGAIFEGVEANVNVDELTGSGTLETGFAGSGYVAFNIGVNNGSSTFAGVIANDPPPWGDGVGNIDKKGTGTLTLTGASTYSGTTTVSAGTLTFLNQTVPSAEIDIIAGAILDIDYTNTSGIVRQPTTTITGGGTLEKTGAGEFVFGGAGTINWDLSAGALIDVEQGNLVGGSVVQDVWTSNLSDLYIAAGATFQGAEANVNVDKLTGSGTLMTGYADNDGYISFNVGVNNGSSTFAGAITDSPPSRYAGNGALNKVGTGTLRLTGASTYTGTTTVSAGTLLIDGSTTSSSAVTVDSGATLGGSGTVGGTITVDSGGHLAPGDNAPGIINTDSIALSAGSSFNADIDGATAGTQYSQADVTGTVSLSGATLNVSSSLVANSLPAGTVIDLIANDGGDAVSGTFSGLPQGATVMLGTVQTAISYTGGPDGNSVTLTVSGNVVVPALDAGPFVLEMVGPNVVLTDNGTVIDSELAAALTSYTLNAGAYNTQLTVNFSGGDPIPSGGLTFTGNASYDNTLDITGESGVAETYNFTDAHDGSVVVGGSTINYTGLSPIADNGSATTRAFDYNSTSAGTIQVDAAAAGSNTITAAGLGETVTFTDPTQSLAINANNAANTVIINTIDPGFNAALTISATTPGSVATVNTALSLGSTSGPSTGAVSITASTIDLNASVSTNANGITTAGSVELAGAVTLGANVAIDTNAATSGNITFGGSIAGGGDNLSLDSGTNGAVSVAGAASGLGTLTVVDSGGVAFNNTLGAATVAIPNTTGTVQFVGTATINTLTTAAQPYNVEFETGGTVASAASFLNTGTVTLGNSTASAITFTGGLDTSGGPSDTSLAGSVTTTNSPLTLGKVTLTAATTTSAGSGALDFAGTVDGAFTLAADSSGPTTFAQAVGGTTPLAGLTTDAGGTTAIDATVINTSNGSQTYNDNVTLGANATLTASGTGGIVFGAAVDDSTNATHALVLTAGSGGVSLRGVGQTTPLNGLTITTAHLTTLGGSIATDNLNGGSGNVNLSAASGGIELVADVTIDTDSGGSGGGGAVNLSGSAVNSDTAATARALTISAGNGAVTLPVVGTTTTLKGLSVTTSGVTTLEGNITTDNVNSGTGNVDLSGATGGIILASSANADTLTIDTDAGGSGGGGAVNLSGSAVNSNALATAQGLTIDASTGAVTLPALGATTTLKFLNVTTSGLTTLGGNITTDYVNASTGHIALNTATGGIILTSNVTIDTDANGDGTGGNVDLSGSAVTSSVAGAYGLTITAANADLVGVTLGQIGSATNPLAFLSVSNTDKNTLKGSIFTASNVGSGDVTFSGNANIVLTGTSVTIDTDQGNVGNGGAVNVNSSALSASALNLNLTINTSTTAAGMSGGAVTLSALNNAGAQDINQLTINTSGPAAGASYGAVTLGGNAALANTVSITGNGVTTQALSSTSGSITINAQNALSINGNVTATGHAISLLAWIPTEPKTPNDCPTPVIMARCVGVLVLGFTPRSAGRPRFD